MSLGSGLNARHASKPKKQWNKIQMESKNEHGPYYDHKLITKHTLTNIKIMISKTPQEYQTILILVKRIRYALSV